jgi:GTP cyclohydrolase I
MKDIQSQYDGRGIEIDKVGVSDLRYPIAVLDRKSQHQKTVARLAISVMLPHEFKGTHMSRFIEVLNSYRDELTVRTIPLLLRELQRRLNAEAAHIDVKFPYFMEKSAPVTGAQALMDYDCCFSAEINGGALDFVVAVQVPVTTLCPCSKAISEYGAHNQRGYVAIKIRSKKDGDGLPQFVWLEELIELAESSASCQVYPLLKRADERHVTMRAYENPAFVEDVVREVAAKLKEDHRIEWFEVHVRNEESIHNHSAFATVEWSRPITHENMMHQDIEVKLDA